MPPEMGDSVDLLPDHLNGAPVGQLHGNHRLEGSRVSSQPSHSIDSATEASGSWHEDAQAERRTEALLETGTRSENCPKVGDSQDLSHRERLAVTSADGPAPHPAAGFDLLFQARR